MICGCGKTGKLGRKNFKFYCLGKRLVFCEFFVRITTIINCVASWTVAVKVYDHWVRTVGIDSFVFNESLARIIWFWISLFRFIKNPFKNVMLQKINAVKNFWIYSTGHRQLWLPRCSLLSLCSPIYLPICICFPVNLFVLNTNYSEAKSRNDSN